MNFTKLIIAFIIPGAEKVIMSSRSASKNGGENFYFSTQELVYFHELTKFI